MTAEKPSTSDPLDAFHPAVAAWFSRLSRAHRRPGAAWPILSARRRHWSPRPPDRARRSPRSSRHRRTGPGRPGQRPLPDETLWSTSRRSRHCPTTSASICKMPLAGIAAELERSASPPHRHPHRRAHRRHHAAGAQRAEKTRAAYPRDHAGIAVRAARFRFRPRMLSTVRTVIVDEIHALAGSKRGSASGAQPRAARRAVSAALRRGSACRRRRKPIERGRALSGGRCKHRKRFPRTAQSSTSVTSASAISRWRCRPCRSKR